MLIFFIFLIIVLPRSVCSGMVIIVMLIIFLELHARKRSRVVMNGRPVSRTRRGVDDGTQDQSTRRRAQHWAWDPGAMEATHSVARLVRSIMPDGMEPDSSLP